MKHIRTLFVAALTLLTFTACDDKSLSYLPESHWLLHVDGVAEGHRLGLTFSGEQLTVRDASSSTPPFSDDVWDYYIEDGVNLVIYRENYDYDGDYTTESYTLGYSSDESLTSLTLVYSPLFGHDRTYVFDRR